MECELCNNLISVLLNIAAVMYLFCPAIVIYIGAQLHNAFERIRDLELNEQLQRQATNYHLKAISQLRNHIADVEEQLDDTNAELTSYAEGLTKKWVVENNEALNAISEFCREAYDDEDTDHPALNEAQEFPVDTPVTDLD